MNEKISEEIKEVIIARLQTMPENLKLSLGSMGYFDKDEIIEHVKKEDEIGNKIIEIQLKFIRALKKGILDG